VTSKALCRDPSKRSPGSWTAGKSPHRPPYELPSTYPGIPRLTVVGPGVRAMPWRWWSSEAWGTGRVIFSAWVIAKEFAINPFRWLVLNPPKSPGSKGTFKGIPLSYPFEKGGIGGLDLAAGCNNGNNFWHSLYSLEKRIEVSALGVGGFD